MKTKLPAIVLTAFLEPSRLSSLSVWKIDREGLISACAKKSGFDPHAHLESLLVDLSPEASHPGREALERLAIKALMTPSSEVSLGSLGKGLFESGSALLRRQSSLGFDGETPLDVKMGFIDLLIHNSDQKASADQVDACRKKSSTAILKISHQFEALTGAFCRYIGSIEADAWDDYKERALLIQRLLERSELSDATESLVIETDPERKWL